jgi:hypothetical protein
MMHRSFMNRYISSFRCDNIDYTKYFDFTFLSVQNMKSIEIACWLSIMILLEIIVRLLSQYCSIDSLVD